MRRNKKDSKTKRNLTIALLIILLLTWSFAFVNSGQLMRSPFLHELPMDEPIAAVENDEGCTAVLDSIGTRFFILSPEDIILATVSFSDFSDVTPTAADRLALDDARLYVLDHSVSENGASLTGDRILVYDLNGTYQQTLLSSEDIADEEHSYRMLNLYAHGDRVYATLWDEMDPSAVIVGDISEGDLNILHCFHMEEQEVYDIFYQPETDSTTAVSQKGDVFLWKGETETVWDLKNSELHLDDVYPYGDGLIALDRNAHTIALYDGEMNAVPLRETAAQNFSLHGDRVVYTDPQTYSLARLDLNRGITDQICVLFFSQEAIYTGYLVWGMALAGAVALVLLLVMFFQTVFARWNERRKLEESHVDALARPMTTSRLYAPIFIFVILGFFATSVVLGSFYYSREVEKHQASVINTAIILRDTAPDSFGDALGAINSQTDYGTEAYEELQNMVTSICMRDSLFGGAHHLSCTIYRFSETEDPVLVVSDPADKNRIGTVMSRDDQEAEVILTPIESIKEEGSLYESYITYNNTTQYYQVYAPIWDSSGELVGAVVPTMNKTYMASQVRETLFSKLLEVFTLLAGLSILFGEILFTKEVAKIQHKRHLAGIRNTTVVEAHRPLLILVKLPGSVAALFCTLLATTILEANGNGGSPLLIALPVTLDAIAFAAVRILLSPVFKYRPKFYMLLGNIIVAAGAVLLAMASILNGYTLLLGASLVFGIGCAISTTPVKAIRSSGLEPDPKYSLMVFCGPEGSIASAVGVALGSVLRGLWGDLAAIAFVGIIPLVTIAAVLYFVGTDIAVSKTQGPDLTHSLRKTTPKAMLRFMIRPAIVIVFLFTLLPIGYLGLFKTYLLPLLNESSGSPSYLIGTITLLIQLLSLMALSPILDRMNRNPDSHWIAGGYGLLAAVLFLFGLTGTMRGFVLVLVVIAVCAPIFLNVADCIIIQEAKAANIIATDAMVPYESFRYFSSFTGPVLLTFMASTGYANLGWIWGGICGVLVLLTLLLRSVQKKKIDYSSPV